MYSFFMFLTRHFSFDNTLEEKKFYLRFKKVSYKTEKFTILLKQIITFKKNE